MFRTLPLLFAALIFLGVQSSGALAQDAQAAEGMRAFSEGLMLENEQEKYPEALAKYQESCAYGLEKGCDAVVLFHGYGIGTERDVVEVRHLAEAGCTRGNGQLCDILANAYFRGDFGTDDPESGPGMFSEGLEYKKLACVNDDPYACKTLSEAYAKGIGEKLSQNTDKEYFYAIKACRYRYDNDDFFMSMCDRVNEIQDKKLASITYTDPEIYAPLCELSIPRYCFDLGVSYINGSEIYPKSYTKAHSYFEKACDKDYEKACTNLGIYYRKGSYGKTEDLSKAAAYLSKSCSLDEAVGCSEMGLLHETGPARYKDYDLAIAYYDKACDLKYGLACYFLGSAYFTGEHLNRRKDDAKAAYYAKRGCNADSDPEACRLSKRVAEFGNAANERAIRAQREAQRRDDAERARQAQEMGRAQSFVSGLYDTQTSPSQKRVCANIYQGGRMTYECMTQEHFDRYFKP